LAGIRPIADARTWLAVNAGHLSWGCATSCCVRSIGSLISAYSVSISAGKPATSK
jgi:hypothetical protein